MKKKALLAKLRAHKGPIWLDINNFNDGFWMQGVKADVIAQIAERFASDEDETGFELCDKGYFGKDYAAQD